MEFNRMTERFMLGCPP